MNLKLLVLLNNRMISAIFLKIFMDTIQIKNAKYWSCLMIWLLICLVTKKFHTMVTQLFIRSWKINFCFYLAILFCSNKNIRLNSKHYFNMKIRSKWKLQQILINHSSDIDFINLYKKCTAKAFFLGQWYYSCIKQFFTL